MHLESKVKFILYVNMVRKTVFTITYLTAIHFALLSCIVNAKELVIDESNTIRLPLINECGQGFEVFSNFTCADSQAIPPEDQTDREGFWSACKIPTCSFRFLRPNATDFATSISILAYFNGEASINVEILPSGETRKFYGTGWQDNSLDLTQFADYELIGNIKITPVYMTPQEFVIIDRIIFDIGEPDTTTTEPTTTIPTTTIPTTTESTTTISTTTPPTTTIPTTTPPTTTIPTTTPPTTSFPTTTPITTTIQTTTPPTTTTQATGEIVILDVVGDLNSAWENNCVTGYHESQDFSCNGRIVIPVEDYNGNDGFWSKCPDEGILSCTLIYHPPSNSTKLSQLTVEGYFAATSVITIMIHTNTGYSSPMLAGIGWESQVIDLRSYTKILDISFMVEYHDFGFTILDKIIIESEP